MRLDILQIQWDTDLSWMKIPWDHPSGHFSGSGMKAFPPPLHL